MLSPAQLAGLIDHTLLKPEATADDILRLCREAHENAFCSVCVNPVWVAHAAAELHGTPVKVCSVAGFPLGATLTAVKADETRRVIELGAQEVDMVLNLGALKSGDRELVRADIAAVANVCRQQQVLCKVILETCLLTHDEKIIACQLCVETGAHFVKTSTGFSTGGATAEDIRLMAAQVKAAGLGVKASGGIRTLADARAMLDAGATRLGVSAGVKILTEARGAAR
ncbi:MAG: deoxyribose-phosphate aldolase [Verrucomicrobia bacterium]|nr:MAG: deoxyribose-phosphate aldolase [Verrucomicrobiota bacterium]